MGPNPIQLMSLQEDQDTDAYRGKSQVKTQKKMDKSKLSRGLTMKTTLLTPRAGTSDIQSGLNFCVYVIHPVCISMTVLELEELKDLDHR